MKIEMTAYQLCLLHAILKQEVAADNANNAENTNHAISVKEILETVNKALE